APLWPRRLLERGPAHHGDAMPVPPPLVQQRGRRLDQALPNPGRSLVAIANNRTPDGFQGLVCEPILAGVEEVASARQDRSTLVGSHGRQKAARGARGGTGTATAALCRPLAHARPLAAL